MRAFVRAIADVRNHRKGLAVSPQLLGARQQIDQSPGGVNSKRRAGRIPDGLFRHVHRDDGQRGITSDKVVVGGEIEDVRAMRTSTSQRLEPIGGKVQYVFGPVHGIRVTFGSGQLLLDVRGGELLAGKTSIARSNDVLKPAPLDTRVGAIEEPRVSKCNAVIDHADHCARWRRPRRRLRAGGRWFRSLCSTVGGEHTFRQEDRWPELSLRDDLDPTGLQRQCFDDRVPDQHHAESDQVGAKDA